MRHDTATWYEIRERLAQGKVIVKRLEAIESLEDLLFAGKRSDTSVQRRSFELRKSLVRLRRVVLPMREVVNSLMRRDLRMFDILARQAADLIERKHAEHALRESDRRKDEFLAILSHELRNPLAPIGYAAEIMKRSERVTPEMQWVREVLDRQVHQMGRLLDDLLDVSRITRGTIELRRRPVELRTRKAAAVLGYLALSETKQESRERLVGLLWSRSDEEKARASLRQVIRELRTVLGEAGFATGELLLCLASKRDVAAERGVDAEHRHQDQDQRPGPAVRTTAQAHRPGRRAPAVRAGSDSGGRSSSPSSAVAARPSGSSVRVALRPSRRTPSRVRRRVRGSADTRAGGCRAR